MFDTTISELIVKCFTCMLPTNDTLMSETILVHFTFQDICS